MTTGNTPPHTSSTEENHAQLAAAAVPEWETAMREGTRYTLDLDHTQLICLIGVAQLGLRHPENTGSSRDYAARAIMDLVNLLPPGSASRQMAGMGFEERFDVPRGSASKHGARIRGLISDN